MKRKQILTACISLLMICTMLACFLGVTANAEVIKMRTAALFVEAEEIEGDHTGADAIPLTIRVTNRKYSIVSSSMTVTLPDGFRLQEEVTFPYQIGALENDDSHEFKYHVLSADAVPADNAADPEQESGGCGAAQIGTLSVVILLCAGFLLIPGKKKYTMLLAVLICLPVCIGAFSVEVVAEDPWIDMEVPFTYNGTEYRIAVHVDYEIVDYARPVYSSYTEPEYPLVEDADFYVAANGDDANSGTKDAPFATFEKARVAVNERKAQKQGDVKVAIMAGTYFDNAILLGQEDGGTDAGRVIWCKYGDGEVILDGGVALTEADMQPLNDTDRALFRSDAADSIRRVDLTKFGLQEANVTLYDNEKRCVIARYPNVDPETGRDVFITGIIPSTKAEHSFTVHSDIAERLAGYHTFDGVQLNGYFTWDWLNEHNSIVNYDPLISLVTMNYSHGVKSHGKFYVEYVSEELDAPGEYFVDASTMTMYLVPGEDSDFHLALGHGSRIQAQCDKVSFVGLSAIACSDGFSASGNDILFDLCRVTDVNGVGISVNGYRNKVTRCEVSHVGYDCVSCNGGDMETLTHAESIIDNCSLHDFGEVQKTYYGAVRIEGGVGITVSHCEMYNGPHLAVHSWGNDIIFEYNVFHDVVLQSSDAGAFYQGRTWTNYGCIERYNLFYDISGDGYKGSALYWDDGLSGQTAYGNVFYNVAGYGMLVGGGRDNTIQGNLFINSGMSYDARFRDALTTKDGAYYEFVNGEKSVLWDAWLHLPQNDIWKNKYPALFAYDSVDHWDDFMYNRDNPANPANCVITDNIFIRRDADIVGIVHQMGTVERNVKYDVKINPGFTDPSNGDYSLREGDTLIRQNGQDVSFPTSEMGRY